jgi:flagellar FliJ protein
MTPTKPLHTVAKITSDHERTAALAMSRSREEMDAQLARLEELEDYRQQYLQQFQTAGRQGLSAVRLQEYQVFLARLDTAITQQRQMLEGSRLAFEEKQSQWLGLRGEVKAIHKLIHRREQQLTTKQKRREQAESDDHASQSSRWRMP